jgi:hypothetical protein
MVAAFICKFAGTACQLGRAILSHSYRAVILGKNGWAGCRAMNLVKRRNKAQEMKREKENARVSGA